MKTLFFIMMLSFSGEFKFNGNNSYFNGEIDQIDTNSFHLKSHQNPRCAYVSKSHCRKVGVSFVKSGYSENKVRKYNFDFTVEESQSFPGFLIIFQDWVRIHDDDANGNRPITTIKLRKVGGKLFIQHFENAWQWDTRDFDTHLTPGLETMHGEYEIFAGKRHKIELITLDAGMARLYINGIKISNAFYKTTHKYNQHTAYFGMYWSKGFNAQHNQRHSLSLSLGDIQYKESSIRD